MAPPPLLYPLLALICLAGEPPAGSSPFFVFDNGLRDPDHPTIETQLELAREIGFAGLSWRTDSPENLRRVLDGARQRHLRVFTIYCNLELKNNTLTPDPRLHDLIPLCRDQDTILWPTLTSTQFKNSDPAGDDLAVAALQRLAATCATHGVRIALYPHVGMWVHRLEDALRLVRKVDRPNVGLTFNLCHALMDGAEDRIPKLLEDCAPHLFVVTINGADSHPPRPTWTDLIQPLGRGTYNVGGVLRHLRQLGYRGPVGLQCYGLQGRARDHLVPSMNAWNNLLP